MKLRLLAAAAIAAPIALAQPAFAAPGDPVKIGDGFSIDPIVDLRLRYEGVDTPTLDADAVTLRVRAGAELKHTSGLSALVEAEGTLALVDNYNAFPFAIVDPQRRTAFAVVADPMTAELNRLQIQYKGKAATVTVGRQRINYDDQRWWGNSAPFRQNDQTYDAVRGEAKLGPVMLDASYAIAMRTVFGVEAGPRTAYDGNYFAVNGGTKLGPVTVKGFAYLLDFDLKEQAGTLALPNADTQTYGARATGAFKLSPRATLNLTASYAVQSDWKNNTSNYAADYIAAEAGLVFGQFGVLAGYEKMGSDAGRAVQTPFAALHKFDGWADQFLTTPANGLEDWYAGAQVRFPKVKALPGLNAAVTYHRFDSDVGSLHYGDEWDASVGFKVQRFTILAKYANYNVATFGTDTQKFWLQAELAF